MEKLFYLTRFLIFLLAILVVLLVTVFTFGKHSLSKPLPARRVHFLTSSVAA